MVIQGHLILLLPDAYYAPDSRWSRPNYRLEVFEDKVDPINIGRLLLIDSEGMESKLHKNIDDIKMVMIIELGKYC